MAGATIKQSLPGRPGSALRTLIAEHNKLVADVELIRAAVTAMATKLDADAGVTDTDYAAAATLAAIDTAAEMLAAKLGDSSGTAYT